MHSSEPPPGRPRGARAVVRQLRDRARRSFPGQVVRRFVALDGGLHATSIAFNALFAMFPIIVAILAIAGLVLRDEALLAAVRAAIVAAFPPGTAGAIDEALTGTRQSAGLLGALSFVGLLLSGSTLFGAIEAALCRVYGVRERPFLAQKLIAFGMILVFAILLVLSVAASSVAAFAVELLRRTPLGDIPALGILAALASWAISIVAGLALFIAIYRAYPANGQRLAEVLPGAGLAAGSLFLLSHIFPLYARLFVAINALGALFGFFLLLLTWLSLVGQIVVLGAVLNEQLMRRAVDETSS